MDRITGVMMSLLTGQVCGVLLIKRSDVLIRNVGIQLSQLVREVLIGDDLFASRIEPALRLCGALCGKLGLGCEITLGDCLRLLCAAERLRSGCFCDLRAGVLQRMALELHHLLHALALRQAEQR